MPSFVGFLYCFCCYFTILAGYFCLYCHLLPALLISNKLYRCSTDIIFTFWQCYATALLELVIGCNIQVTGDPIDSDEMSILVMNHRTRTDWNFLWPALYHAIEGKNKYKYSTKFILKDTIRHLPGPGWVMQLTLSIFIRRCWKTDMKIMEKFCKYISALSYKCSVLIFPEGTDFTEETKRKSDDYAAKNGLQPLKYVLHPRTTGFAYITNKLLEENCLEAVYDLTIFYADCIPQSENVLLQGFFPKQIKVHVKRHSICDLPRTEEDLKNFLQDLWLKKENLLEEYHKNPDLQKGKILKCRNKTLLHIAFMFWNMLLIISISLLLFNPNFRMICFIHSIFLISINLFMIHGFQCIEIIVHELREKIL